MQLKHFLLFNQRCTMTMTPRYAAMFTSRVFVEGLPVEWTHHEIA